MPVKDFDEFYETCYQLAQGFITEAEFRAAMAALSQPEEDELIIPPMDWHMPDEDELIIPPGDWQAAGLL